MTILLYRYDGVPYDEFRYPSGDIKVEWFTFPGGEEHVRILENIMDIHKFGIKAIIKSSSDLIRLRLLVDAIRRNSGVCPWIGAAISYLPYARQDRVCNPGEALGIGIAAEIINSCKFDRVRVMDPHSDVGPALINNVRVVGVKELFQSFFSADWEFRATVETSDLVAPDAGANKKVFGLAQEFKRNFIRADKVRDVATGEITGVQVFAEHSQNDMLVVDDICDGGRTFTELAKELNKITTGRLSLYVTHGIFSKGVEPLLEWYDQVFVANDMLAGKFFNRYSK